MKWMLAAVLVAMTGCATDAPTEPADDSDPVQPADMKPLGNESVNRLAVSLVDCMPVMVVSGSGPYSVQCAVAYAATDAGAQIEYIATDGNGATWVSARAAAPVPTVPDSHGVTVFALESATVPAGDALTVKIKLVDDALPMQSNEMSAAIELRH